MRQSNILNRGPTATRLAELAGLQYAAVYASFHPRDGAAFTPWLRSARGGESFSRAWQDRYRPLSPLARGFRAAPVGTLLTEHDLIGCR